MKVLKFGGTSVGNPERMRSVAKIINDNQPKIVVLSAVSGTTNSLLEIGNLLAENKIETAKEKIDILYQFYVKFVDDLYSTPLGKTNGNEVIENYFTTIREISNKKCGIAEQKVLLAQGELISTHLFFYYLNEVGIKTALLPALEFMKIDEDEEPILSYIETELPKLLNKYPTVEIYITQGYIARNSSGGIDNLKRGGSDYTATLIGAALRCEEVQIWTDIDGMHNNDPRVVKKTFAVRQLSFDEAAELAYFGAKILHPTCIRPTMERNVPVRLLNTLQPSDKGTLISAENTSGKQITAIAAKDNITAIKIKSGRMLNAYGFLRRVFEIFEKYKTPIDVITTSEVALSMTIDNDARLNEIVSELSLLGHVEVDKDLTIICIVGNFSAEENGIVLKIFEALKEIPIRMISYGGSRYNTTLLVRTSYKNLALNLLNEGLFKDELAMV